jgi:hypothetical protein
MLNQPFADEIKLKEKFLTSGPGALAGAYLNMRALPVDDCHAKTHVLFEHIAEQKLALTTIGIGDGGNEIGMGVIPWEVMCDNIRNGLGGKIACRISTYFTIVAGVSNWGAYALLASMCILLEKEAVFLHLISEVSETLLMEYLMQEKLAVDGVLGYPAMSVDGMDWQIHLIILKLIRHILNLRCF